MLSQVSAPRTIGAAMLALALTWSAGYAAASPLEDLRECAAKMQPTHAATKNLAEQCPDLDAVLDSLALSRLLDPVQRERLNSDALDDFAALVSRYSVARPTSGPSTASLTAVAEQVNGKKIAAPLSVWDRLKSWVKDLFSQAGPSAKNGFDEWLRRMSDSTAVLNAILYGCMGIVVSGALLVVFIEMRAAGMLRGKAARSRAHSREALGGETLQVPFIDSGAGVPRLLSLLVARLVATRRLQFERALTHRELVARSIFDTPEQRSAFARVSQAAEALVYGGVAETAIPQPVLEQGSSLLAQITEIPAKETA